MRKKFFLIGIIVVILLLSGSFLFYQRIFNKKPHAITYTNATFGYKLNLPPGWNTCISQPSPAVLGVGSIGYECSEYTIAPLSYYELMNPHVERLQNETFLDYVKRISPSVEKELAPSQDVGINPTSTYNNLNSSAVIQKISYVNPQITPASTLQRNILYIEDPQTHRIYIVNSYAGLVYSTEDDSNLHLIYSHFKAIPITTGDVYGQTSDIIKEGEMLNPKVIPGFKIKVYSDFDKNKKLVAQTTSNKDGYFLMQLKPGTYYLQYPNGVWQSFSVVLGNVISLNPALKPEGAPNPPAPILTNTY